MARSKTPDYDEMSLEELNAASTEHYSAIRELRERVTDGMTASERLPIEEEIANHRAHLAVINPLRTEAGVTEELARSDFARKAKGMTKAEWARLQQVIGVDDVPSMAEAHEPEAAKR